MRVICHLDLDCFYCQVEHIRLNIPRDEPLCVQQWSNVIAVNYAARACGIKRGMNIKECKLKCPNIHLIHVELIGNNTTVSSNTDTTSDEQSPNRLSNNTATSKVSLERYRKASEAIMSIFQRFSSLCERASIDEAYLDITDQIHSETGLNKHHAIDSEIDTIQPDIHSTTIDSNIIENISEINDNDSIDDDQIITYNGTKLTCYTNEDKVYYQAAKIISKLRQTVFNELNFTVSAGIASNKLLAKQASASRKPNKQTIVLTSSIQTLMTELSIEDLRGLGGKLGESIVQYYPEITKAVHIQSIPLSDLNTKFGTKVGLYIYNICRGIDNDLVKANLKQKSLQACKSFTNPLINITQLDQWINILGSELVSRITNDKANHNRYPRLLSTHIRLTNNNQAISKSCQLSNQSSSSINELIKVIQSLIHKVGTTIYPCSMFALSVSDFIDLPDPTAKSNIKNFFLTNISNSCVQLKTNEDTVNMTNLEEKVDASNDISIDKNASSLLSSPTSNSIINIDTTTENYVSCIECGCSVLDDAKARAEHKDYHVALKLQRLYEAPSLKRNIARSIPAGTKTTSESDSKKMRGGGIESFFRKK